MGPTASGKTALAVAVALRLGGNGAAELVNADSRQVIRGLRAGTCAPTTEELRGVRCHLLDLRDPGERFTVADWAALAQPLLDGLAARGTVALLTGGTGLYVSAALDGLALAGGHPDPVLRAERDRLGATADGLAALLAELDRRDPAGGTAVDRANPRRVVRALEIVDALGSVAAGRGRLPERAALRIGLEVGREELTERIRRRAERLVGEGGLLREVVTALERGIGRPALEGSGIGYREALGLLDGRLSPEAAVDAIAHRTRRYAKAQRTWFRRDPRIRWLPSGGGGPESLVDSVIDALHEDAGPGQRLHRRR